MNKDSYLSNVLAVNNITKNDLTPQKQYMEYLEMFARLIEHDDILVICDADCDGLSSARIWREYRPNDEIVALDRTSRDPFALASRYNNQVIVCLDCGSSVDWTELTDREIYIIDHHETQLMTVNVVYINPVIDFGHTTYCTSTLLYSLFASLLGKNSTALQYAAIAGVADMTPLLGDNRAVVVAGIKKMNGDDKCDIVQEINAYDINDEIHIGFSIAPSINAPSRIGTPEVAFDAIVNGNRDAIKKLKSANTKRKSLVDKHYADAKVIRAKNCLVYIIEAPNLAIHGLIANKAASKEHTSVMCINGSSVSFRSRQDINFDSFVSNNSDIISGGGHKQAAGASIIGDVNTLIERFQSFCESSSFEKKEEYDVLVDGKDIISLRNFYKEYKPYGMGFRQLTCGSYLTVYQIGKDFTKTSIDSGYAELHLKSGGLLYYCVCYDINRDIKVGEEYFFYFDFANNRLNIKWIE